MCQYRFLTEIHLVNSDGILEILYRLVPISAPSDCYQYQLHPIGTNISSIRLVPISAPSDWYQYQLHPIGTNISSIRLVPISAPSDWYQYQLPPIGTNISSIRSLFRKFFERIERRNKCSFKNSTDHYIERPLPVT